MPADELFRGDGRLRLEVFSDRAARALRAAVDCAKATGWDALRSPHLFMGLLTEADPVVRAWARKAKLPLQKTLRQFREVFTEDHVEKEATLALHREFLSDNVISILRRARLRAAKNRRRQINCIDLLYTILNTPGGVVPVFLRSNGFTPSQLCQLAVEIEDAAEPEG